MTFEVFLKCVIDTLSMDLLPFYYLHNKYQMLHILCGTDVLSQRMMENMFVSQAGVSNIVFYTSTANDTTQQEWLYLTLGVLYLLFSIVFSEKEGQHNAAIQLLTLLYVLNSPTDSVALT